MAINYSGKLGAGEDRPRGLKGGGSIPSLKDKVKKKKTTAGDSLGQALSKPKVTKSGYRAPAAAPKAGPKMSGGGGKL